jgi:CheY-like chemotaxis protein
MRILILEDNPRDVELVRTQLADEGIDYEEALQK